MALRNDQVLPADFVSSTADYARSVYHLRIPRKFSFEQLLQPEVWRLQTKLRPGDLVTVISEDNSFDADLRVLQASEHGGFCVFRVLREFHASKEAVSSDPTGAAHVAFCPAEGSWMLYDSRGEPRSKYATEDTAEAALVEFVSANPHEAGIPAKEAA